MDDDAQAEPDHANGSYCGLAAELAATDANTVTAPSGLAPLAGDIAEAAGFGAFARSKLGQALGMRTQNAARRRKAPTGGQRQSTQSPAYFRRMMRAHEAARYFGKSEGTLRKLPIPSRSPPDARRVLYDRFDKDPWADTLS